jgi:hypothetical protein
MASGFCLALMAFSLPETARNIVENGKIKPPLSARLPFKSFMCHWSNEEAPRHRERRVPNPLKSLKLLLRKDNAALILAGGIIYTVYSCINTALSTQFIKIYDLNQWQVGLIYLPFGLGGTLACVFSGRLIDGLYRRTAKLHSLSTDKVKGDDIDTFPVEEARLKCVSIPVVGAIGFVVAFGWTLDKHLVSIVLWNHHGARFVLLMKDWVAYRCSVDISVPSRLQHTNMFQCGSSKKARSIVSSSYFIR